MISGKVGYEGAQSPRNCSFFTRSRIFHMQDDRTKQSKKPNVSHSLEESTFLYHLLAFNAVLCTVLGPLRSLFHHFHRDPRNQSERSRLINNLFYKSARVFSTPQGSSSKLVCPALFSHVSLPLRGPGAGTLTEEGLAAVALSFRAVSSSTTVLGVRSS